MNIKILYLSFNPLSSESIANVLGEPKTVRELNLAGCNATDVTRLNLSYNHVTTLSDTPFERASLLEMFDLSHNHLKIMPTAWPMLGSLRELGVMGSRLKTISSGTLSGVKAAYIIIRLCNTSLTHPDYAY